MQSILDIPSDEIEIVVSDNASSDNTFSELAELRDERFRYFRNKENLGYTRNVLAVIEKAQGEFVALLSDEERVDADAALFFLKILSHDRDLGLLLCSVRRFAPERGDFEPYIGYQDRRFTNKNEAIRAINFGHPYISGYIYRRTFLELYGAATYAENPAFLYPQVYLGFMCMVRGQTMTSSKVLYEQRSEPESYIRRPTQMRFSHPLLRARQIKLDFRIAAGLPVGRLTHRHLKRALVGRTLVYFSESYSNGGYRLLMRTVLRFLGDPNLAFSLALYRSLVVRLCRSLSRIVRKTTDRGSSE